MFNISVKDVKTFLNIESTQYDEYIMAMLPVTIDLVEKHCNNKFASRNEDGTFLETEEGYYTINVMGLMIIIAKIIEFYLTNAGVSYEGIGRITYTYRSELPKSIIDSMRVYSKSRMKFL